MAVSVSPGRLSDRPTPAHGESAITAAPGPPVATCKECGLVVRFLEGFAPALTGWRGGTCPACERRAARERARWMTREDQKAAVMEELRRDPEAYVEDLVRRTGTARGLVRDVRKRAVQQGIATPVTQIAERQKEREAERAKRAETGVSAEAVRAVASRHESALSETRPR